MHLADFIDIAERCREQGFGFAEFQRSKIAIDLRWPADVLEQWVYEHAHNGAFLRDYGEVDLERIEWEVEAIPTEVFMTMPTGPSGAEDIEYFAKDPDHWVGVRRHGVHLGVGLAWETHGTWKRWPIVLDRALVGASEPGLQLVEGRNRVGILRGRRRRNQRVAAAHLAWVGRERA